MSQIFRFSSSAAGRSRHCSLRLALRWAEVDQRVERVLHDRLGQAARRVVRAGAAAIGPGGHIDAAHGVDDRIAGEVLAQQRGVGLHAGVERGVVVAGRQQPLLRARIQRLRQGLADGVGRAASSAPPAMR